MSKNLFVLFTLFAALPLTYSMAAQNGGFDDDHIHRACYEALLAKENPDHREPAILLDKRPTRSNALNYLSRSFRAPTKTQWKDWYSGEPSLVGHKIVVTELYETNNSNAKLNFYDVNANKLLRMEENNEMPGYASSFPVEGLVVVHTSRRLVIQTSQDVDSPGRFVVVAYPRAALTKTAYWAEKRVKQLQLSRGSNFKSVYQDLSGSANLDEVRSALEELKEKNMQDYAFPPSLLADASELKFFREFRNDLGDNAFEASGAHYTNSIEEAVRNRSFEAMQRGIERDRYRARQKNKTE